MWRDVFFYFFKISLQKFLAIISILIELKLFCSEHNFKHFEYYSNNKFFFKNSSLKFFKKFKKEFKKKKAIKKKMKLFSRDKFKVKIQKTFLAFVFSLPLKIIFNSDFLYTARFCFFKNFYKENICFLGYNLFWYSRLREDLSIYSQFFTQKTSPEDKLKKNIQKRQKNQKILDLDFFFKLRKISFHWNIDKIQKGTSESYYNEKMYPQKPNGKKKKISEKGSFGTQKKIIKNKPEKKIKSFIWFFFQNFNKKKSLPTIELFEFESCNFLYQSTLEGHWALGEFFIFKIIKITNFLFRNLNEFRIHEILYFTNLFFIFFLSKLYKNSKFFSPFVQFSQERFHSCFFFAILENYQKTKHQFSKKKIDWILSKFFFKKKANFFKKKSIEPFFFVFWKPFFNYNFIKNDILFYQNFRGKVKMKKQKVKNFQKIIFYWDFKINWKFSEHKRRNKLNESKTLFPGKLGLFNLNKKSQKNFPQKGFLYFLKNLFLWRKLNLNSNLFFYDPLMQKMFLFIFFSQKKQNAVVKNLSFLLLTSFFFWEVIFLENQILDFKIKKLKKRKHSTSFKLEIILVFFQNLFSKTQKLETKTAFLVGLIDKIKINSKTIKNETEQLVILFRFCLFLKMKFIFYQSRDSFKNKKKPNICFSSIENFKEYQFTTIISSFLEIKKQKENNEMLKRNSSFIFPFLKKLNGMSLSHFSIESENLSKDVKENASRFIFFQINGLGFFSKKKIFWKGEIIRKFFIQIKILSFLERSLFFSFLVGGNPINMTKKKLLLNLKKRNFLKTSLLIFWGNRFFKNN